MKPQAFLTLQFTIISFLISALVCTLYGQPLEYSAKFIDQPILIDGRLDEPAWKDQVSSSLFVDIEGDAKPLPRFDTRVKILWDEDYLYIGATLEEPKVQASFLEKNSYIFHDDNNFEVFVDPNGDHCNYYELELNAFNTIWELSLPVPYRNSGKPNDPDNMPGLKTAVAVYGTINDDSDIDSVWTVELAFLFEDFEKYDAVNTPPRPGDYWRINFSRVEWRYNFTENKYVKVPGLREDNWVWSPQGEINMHAPEHWGILHFQINDQDASTPSATEWQVRKVLMSTYQRLHDHYGNHNSYPMNLPLDMVSDAPFELLYQKQNEGYTLGTHIDLEGQEYLFQVNQSSCLTKSKKQ